MAVARVRKQTTARQLKSWSVGRPGHPSLRAEGWGVQTEGGVRAEVGRASTGKLGERRRAGQTAPAARTDARPRPTAYLMSWRLPEWDGKRGAMRVPMGR